ncbi:MAG: TonB family protein [Bdellovibrionales bacterium]
MSTPIFLRVVIDGKVAQVKQVNKDQFVIGRNADVDLNLDDVAISNIHAMIEKRGSDFYLCDLGSEQGTFLNNEIVLDHPIQTGDNIRLGETLIEFHVGIPKAFQPEAISVKTAVPPVPATVPEITKKPEPVPSIPDIKIPEIPKVPAVEQEVEADTAEGSVDKVQDEKTIVTNVQIPIEVPTSKEPSEVSSVSASSLDDDRMVEATVTPPKDKVEERPGPDNLIGMVPRKKVTFAPESSYEDLDSILTPKKGVGLEILLSWGDRVLETYRIQNEGDVKFGSHPKNEVVIPNIDSIPSSQLLLRNFQSVSQIIVPKEKRGRLFINKSDSISLEEASRQGRLNPNGAFFVLELQQGEMLRLDLESGLSLYISNTKESADLFLGPLSGLKPHELMVFVLAVALSLILYTVATIYKDLDEPELEEKQKKVTTFIFNRPEKPPAPVKQNTQARKSRIVKSPSRVDQKTPKKAKGNPGKAAAVKRAKNPIREKMKTTAAKKGRGAKKPSRFKGKPKKKQGDETKKKPNIESSGLLGVFANSGTQQKVAKLTKGANATRGASQKVTGAGGGRGGSNNSSGLKEVSAGGKGTETYGRTDINTKGKGSGLDEYGDGNLGQKGKTGIDIGGQGEEFLGDIDREAVRRVILNQKAAIKACYDAELNRNFNLSGKVTIGFTIRAKGRVGSAKVEKSTINNKNIEKCLIRRLKTWRFPEPPQGAEAKISFPFAFSAR